MTILSSNVDINIIQIICLCIKRVKYEHACVSNINYI